MFEAGSELGRANLEVFSETLLSLAEEDKNVLAVTSDSRGSGKLVSFAAKLPDQIVEVGVAEQNLVGIAAGLASTGKIVYAVSPACFLTARALEQIKNDVCYSDRPVKLIGISAGVSYGALGSTHHSTHEVAAMRAINNIDILVPADNFETAQAIKVAAKMTHPVYIRFGKRPMYHLHKPGTKFEVGKSITIRQGTDVALIATGETVYHALMAVENSSGVYLVPAFSGLGAPHWKMDAKAAILGLTFGCDKNHVVRAALESIPYQIKDVITAMEQDSGIKLTELRVDGGITGNHFVMQLLADLLKTNVVNIGVEEVSALGAAYLAGLQHGIFRNIDQLKNLSVGKRRFSPGRDSSKVRASYEGWKEAVQQLLWSGPNKEGRTLPETMSSQDDPKNTRAGRE